MSSLRVVEVKDRHVSHLLPKSHRDAPLGRQGNGYYTFNSDSISYFLWHCEVILMTYFVFLRPFWKDYCYQTGYLMGGREMREGSKTGPCPFTVSGGQWFNVRLEIRGQIVTVIMNNFPAGTFKSHYPANNKGSGVLVTGGCRKSIRFRNLGVSSLSSLPFVAKNCQSARVAGDGYKLLAYSGEQDVTHPGICRALYPKVVEGNSYVISVNIYTQESLLSGKYGVIFNVKNADNFEFVYFR